MLRYTLKRLAQMIALLLAISIIIFVLFAIMPGDFYSSNMRLSPERLAQLRAAAGLDKPIWQRYLIWLGNTLHGNLGYSMQYNEPVTHVMNTYMWNSFLVAVITLVLSWTLAVIIGVYSATHQYSLFDRIVTVLVFVSLSFPSFFIGLMMIKIFAVDLKILPTGGMFNTGSESTGFARILEVAHHLIMPVGILTFLSTGSLTRYFRSGMIDVLRADFIRTARARGIKEHAIVFRHALRNALLPMITMLAFELPGLFSGAIITEQVFNWPGIGHVQLDSVTARDYQLMMTITLFLAALTILGNFLADIGYKLADPRIRLSSKAVN
ncbi:ABC transporter permease [Bifidobacterium bifidum]|uniref:ABC transporter permease n=1 Tax=Bifidobacterium bifidum TaxID=1681 RepID=UPI0012ABCAC6|nr:ABC transporter permease [Bifidobacterium bifidum]